MIPENWKVMRLGEIGSFSKGSGIKREDISETGVPCIRYGELYTRYHNYISEPVSRIPLSVAYQALPVASGDLLFAGSGETAEEIGRCSAYIGAEQAYAGGDIIVFRPIGQNPIFLGHLMNFSTIATQKSRMGQGDAVVHISARNLAEVQVGLPSLYEQCAIAEVLADVDGLLGALEALIAKNRAIKQAAMQQLLTGKTRLPGFSEAWETTTLGDIADIHSGATPNTQISANWNGRIPWCTPSDITAMPGKYLCATERRVTEEGLASCAARLLPVGTLLLCSRATIGEIKIAASPVCTNQGFKSLVCKNNVSNQFLYYLLSTLKTQLIERAIGSTFLEIGRRDVASIELRVPTYVEQCQIAVALSDMDDEITPLERRRDKTLAIKQGMIQQLLSGRIRLVESERTADV